ncbi:MAG TPA: OmpA family protein [Kofleriaceae bacterium]|nr:OmpA family protein [Kofleriaceae bacterium]
MKTLLATLVLAAAATPAAAGPDFVTSTPRPRALAASDGVTQIAPMDDVLFESDADALSPLAQQQLASAAAWLERNPRYRLVLEGYTDAAGQPFYNEDLATRRAAHARAHLITLGVPSHRIIIVVYGEAAARASRDPLARRVVLYATHLPPRTIAAASLDRKRALSAVWVEQGTLYTQERTPRTLVGER